MYAQAQYVSLAWLLNCYWMKGYKGVSDASSLNAMLTLNWIRISTYTAFSHLSSQEFAIIIYEKMNLIKCCTQWQVTVFMSESLNPSTILFQTLAASEFPYSQSGSLFWISNYFATRKKVFYIESLLCHSQTMRPWERKSKEVGNLGTFRLLFYIL